LILLVIRCADGGRAFEHHVLEQMGDAGDAGAFICAADMRDPATCDGGIVVAFDHQQRHAIGEGFFHDVNFLGGERCDERELREDDD